MNLKRVKITNFLSIKSLEIDMESYKGLTLIDGSNQDLKGSNGSGKSSIIEAITWCLYGKSLRGAVGREFIHHGEKSCNVSVEFDSGLCVVRSRGPSSLMVFSKEESYTGEKISETERTLESLLGVSYRLFLSTICLGQHNEVRFFELTADGKREVIKNFLNLPELDGIRSLIASKKSKIKVDVNNNSLEKTLKKVNKAIETKAKKAYKRLGFLPLVNKAFEDELEYIDGRKRTLLEEQETLKFWEKNLSQKGHIRTLVGQVILPLNEKLSYWTKECFPDFTVSVNHELEEEITILGNPVAYNSLSGGERRLVNLCLLLSLSEFVCESYAIPFNFIFLDEVAENLDSEKIKSLHNLLQKFSERKNVFLITHNQELKDQLKDNKIMLEKRSGVTELL